MFTRWRRWEPAPDVFGIVMATGIVSVAAEDHGYPAIAAALSSLAIVAFVGLALGVLSWGLTHSARVVQLAREPDVVLRTFTFVAACAVLRLRLHQLPATVWLLGVPALLAWITLVPVAALDVAVRTPAELQAHARGAWLLPSVATSGLAGIGADLGAQAHAPWLAAAATGAWVLALLCYLGVVTLMVGRMMSGPVRPDDITPDSWILMGALAIATLAGDHLLTAARTLSAPDGVATALRTTTVTIWALAGLWIPFLLWAALWRFDRVAGSLHYHRVWWTAVFPLGMFSAASWATAGGAGLPGLETVSLVFFWDAFVLWALVAAGLVHSAFRGLGTSAGSAGGQRGA